MSTTPSKANPNDLVVDLRAKADILFDLPPRARVGMRTAKKGEEEVRKELIANQPEWGELAGITAADVAVVVECSENIEAIDEELGRIEKLREIALESRAYWVDRRERKYAAMRGKLDASYKETRNDQLRAKFERLPPYCGQSAEKAAKTRQKNAEERKAKAPHPKAELILEVLKARDLFVSDNAEEKILATDNEAVLNRWLTQVGTVAAVEELFA